MENESGFTSEILVDEADYAMFRKLKYDPNFIHWRTIVERFQQQRAYNFIAGVFWPEDIKDPREFMRGGYELFTKIMRLIEESDKQNEQISND